MVRRSEAGYTLIFLMVFISILMIGLLVALPIWETQVRREQEEELLFRGRQYVEAVRLYTLKNPGTFPKSIDDLVKGRFLRKHFPDPITKDGAWHLILQGGMPGAPLISSPSPSGRGRGQAPGAPRGNTAAPTQQLLLVPEASLKSVDNPRIIGVVSASTKKSFYIFEENETYDAWLFYYGRTPGAKPEIIHFGSPQK